MGNSLQKTELEQSACTLVERYKLERYGKKLSHKEAEKYLSRVQNVLEKKSGLVSRMLMHRKTLLGNEEGLCQIATQKIKKQELAQGRFFDEKNACRKIGREMYHISENLQNSLQPWMDYLFSPEASYSLSAKYWIKEGLFAFDGRSRMSTKSFPPLNQQALSQVIDIFENKIANKNIENTLGLSEEDFAKI